MAGSRSNGNPSSNIQRLSITGVPEAIREERSQATQSMLSSYDSRDSISTTDEISERKNFPNSNKMTQMAKYPRSREDLDSTSQCSNDDNSCSNTTPQKEKVTFINPNTNDVPSEKISIPLVCEGLETEDIITTATAHSDDDTIIERDSSYLVHNISPEIVTDSSGKSGSSLQDGRKELKPVDDCSPCGASNNNAVSVDPVPNNEKDTSETINFIKGDVLTDSQVVDYVVRCGLAQHQGEKPTKTVHEGLSMKLNDNNITGELMMQSPMTSSEPPLGGSLPARQPSTNDPLLQNTDNKTPQSFSKAKLPQNTLYKSASQNDVTNQSNQLKYTKQHKSSMTIANAQPISNVAIVPGIKGAVVAKKGRFNVLKDSIISPNHIITGNSVSSQQGSVNVVGGLQQLPIASVNDHTPMITNVIQSHPKDSIQPPFPKPGSPRLTTRSLSCGAPAEPKQNGINHITQNIQKSSGNASNPKIQAQSSLISTSSNATSNTTVTNNSVPHGATKIGRFILSSATNQPPNTSVISTTIPSRNSPNLPEGQPQIGNTSVADPKQPSKSTSVQKFVHVSDPRVTQPQQGAPMIINTSNSPTLTAVGATNSNSLQNRNLSILTHSHNPSILHGQQSCNHPNSPPILPNTVNNHPTTSSVFKGSGLSGAIPGGMGKMLHFLDQMRLEATEADKFIISMQKDLKFLRDKNKELEMKWIGAEKRCLDEKKSREISEAKVKCLKKRLSVTKLQPPMVPVGEKQEDESCCDLLDISSKPDMKLSYSRSTSFSSMIPCTHDEQVTDMQNMHRNSITEQEIIEKELSNKQNNKNVRIASDIQPGSSLSIQPSPRECLTAVNETNLLQELKTESLTQQVRSTSSILRDFDPFQPNESICIEHDNGVQNQSFNKKNILESQSVPMFQNVENGVRNHQPRRISSQSFQGIPMDDSINKSIPVSLNNSESPPL